MGIDAPTSLTADHDLTAFDCGKPSLNEWLSRRALDNHTHGGTRTFVVCQDTTVVGYYALAAGAVARAEATGNTRRNMPDPIPVIVLGRLAVDNKWQGKGIGPAMLKDAIQRTLTVSENAGVRALLVHAIDEDAKSFYLNFGFKESPTVSMMFMITINEARQALA